MEKQNPLNRKKAGRIPKDDPAKNRHVFYLNKKDEARFLSLFEQSGMDIKAHFITACLFNKPIKVVKIDKGVQDYYMRLTTFFGQYRMIGINYNQVVKALKSNFTEKKALAFLYKLEQETIKLVEVNNRIIELTREFETKYLQDNDS